MLVRSCRFPDQQGVRQNSKVWVWGLVSQLKSTMSALKLARCFFGCSVLTSQGSA
jgi:hypothetical protein